MNNDMATTEKRRMKIFKDSAFVTIHPETEVGAITDFAPALDSYNTQFIQPKFDEKLDKGENDNFARVVMNGALQDPSNILVADKDVTFFDGNINLEFLGQVSLIPSQYMANFLPINPLTVFDIPNAKTDKRIDNFLWVELLHKGKRVFIPCDVTHGWQGRNTVWGVYDYWTYISIETTWDWQVANPDINATITLYYKVNNSTSMPLSNPTTFNFAEISLGGSSIIDEESFKEIYLLGIYTGTFKDGQTFIQKYMYDSPHVDADMTIMGFENGEPKTIPLSEINSDGGVVLPIEISDVTNLAETLNQKLESPVSIEDVTDLQQALTALDRTHNQLSGRDDADTHPISAITGLTAKMTDLTNLGTDVTTLKNKQHNDFTGRDAIDCHPVSSITNAVEDVQTISAITDLTQIVGDAVGAYDYHIIGKANDGNVYVSVAQKGIWYIENGVFKQTNIVASPTNFPIIYGMTDQKGRFIVWGNDSTKNGIWVLNTPGVFNLLISPPSSVTAAKSVIWKGKLHICSYNLMYYINDDLTIGSFAVTADVASLIVGADGHLYAYRGWNINKIDKDTLGTTNLVLNYGSDYGRAVARPNAIYFFSVIGSGNIVKIDMATGVVEQQLTGGGGSNSTNSKGETYVHFNAKLWKINDNTQSLDLIDIPTTVPTTPQNFIQFGLDDTLFVYTRSGLQYVDFETLTFKNTNVILLDGVGMFSSYVDADENRILFGTTYHTNQALRGIWEIQYPVITAKGRRYEEWVDIEISDIVGLKSKIKELENNIAILTDAINNLILVGNGMTEQELINMSTNNPDSLVVGINVQ